MDAWIYTELDYILTSLVDRLGGVTRKRSYFQLIYAIQLLQNYIPINYLYASEAFVAKPK
jgi:hypothetical protein